MVIETREEEEGLRSDAALLVEAQGAPRPGDAPPAPRKKQRRGFAAMDPAKQREIASKGGRASHAAGTGHEWNSDAARVAGRKGGLASHGGRGRNAAPRRELSAAPATPPDAKPSSR